MYILFNNIKRYILVILYNQTYRLRDLEVTSSHQSDLEVRLENFELL